MILEKDIKSIIIRVISTRNRTPFVLVYYEAFSSEENARKREHNLKLRSNAFNQLKKRIKESINLIN